MPIHFDTTDVIALQPYVMSMITWPSALYMYCMCGVLGVLHVIVMYYTCISIHVIYIYIGYTPVLHV